MLILIVRVIVGLLFIFSGLIKANDPLGLSYKMQEFFELWGMTQFNDYTLSLSIFMNAFEIIAGVAVLLGWRMRIFSWLLLLLIVFFTFLTGYAYLSGKFKNCGCFGDCIPIKPLASFLKDLVLLAMILLLFVYRKRIRPLFTEKVNMILMPLVAIASFGIQLYVLKHLPFFDCLPYKKKNNISEQMKIPANAIPDSTVITFRYKKNGKVVEFTADNFPADFDSTYTDMRRVDKLIRKGKNNEPPIKGFSLASKDSTDATELVLNENYAALLFIEKFKVKDEKLFKELATLQTALKNKNIGLYLLTSNREEANNFVKRAGWNGIPVYTLDYTALRTAARANPTFYLLNKGTIIGKWSYSDLDEAMKVVENLR